MADMYGGEDADAADEEAVDDEKPTWNDDIDITDIVPAEGAGEPKKKKKKSKKKKDAGDADADGVDLAAMDADAPPEDEEEWDGTEEMRKRVLARHLDELAALDFNDLVGDLPTRFRYAPVAPDTFGLAPAEILRAQDAELNAYVGLRTLAPYRAGKWDSQRPARLGELRDALAARGVVVPDAKTADGERPAKRRKGKKERMKLRAKAGGAEGDEEAGEA
jgi:protein KRI1